MAASIDYVKLLEMIVVPCLLLHICTLIFTLYRHPV